MDRERREAEAKENARVATREESATIDPEDVIPANGGLFANIKGGDELLKKLKSEDE